MYLVKKYIDFFFFKIGKLIGNKDYVIVLYVCKIVKD